MKKMCQAIFSVAGILVIIVAGFFIWKAVHEDIKMQDVTDHVKVIEDEAEIKKEKDKLRQELITIKEKIDEGV